MTSGQRVRHFRKAAGLTQKELAERLHIEQGAVSNWERDANALTHANLCAVAAACGVDLATFFGAIEDSKQPPEAA